MQSNIYVSLSGQIALLKRLESIAQNVANASTPGYRAERISFSEVLSDQLSTPVSFVSPGRTYLSTSSGPLEKTGNPLDVALNGNVWLGISTPAGTAYTRDGRLHMTPEGELETVLGYKVVDVGGSPIQIDPQAGQPTISRDGAITQGDRVVGTLGLFEIPAEANLTRFQNASVIPDLPAIPQLDFNRAFVAQGFIERSNTDPIHEISRLIAIQRTFDSITNAVADVEDSLNNAVKTLGS